ncbi:hypothetical protein OOK31_32760 [Streptomyces sp. NBC_00249]|uniref:hypothetical protein n=1 Tax=Streptomyces sp. NBC_00249 TaxID=2975690 RepID=UPI0022533CFC|nr:hypothetical protein [Streptomyces sp. NBC_00249]MCX5198604.1 hypothetical protein [Streptomyces sp. NBC_00249]
MADLYALELALDLDASTPESVLELIAFHLTPEPAEGEWGEWEEGEAEVEEFRVLCGRGAGYRVGGVLDAVLAPAPGGGWRLTARQEIHAETRIDVEEFLAALAPYVPAPAGPVGSLRFYEAVEAEPIVRDAEGVIRLP